MGLSNDLQVGLYMSLFLIEVAYIIPPRGTTSRVTSPLISIVTKSH